MPARAAPGPGPAPPRAAHSHCPAQTVAREPLSKHWTPALRTAGQLPLPALLRAQRTSTEDGRTQTH